MSITGELRKWAEDNTLKDRVLTTCPPQHAVHGVLETLLRIADRIDAEHERAIDAMWEDAKSHMTDESMAEHGWGRLPKDANGVPVCIGDVMEWPDTTTAEVVGVGNGTFFYVEVGENVVEWVRTCDKIHHVQESVEDVLRDVVTLCHNTWKEGSAFEFYDVDDVMKSSNIAEYAAKLRLAEGEDE